MKVALCFIISYNHIVNKEQIWRDWIEPNKDIINVYFHYKDIRLIKSQWIKKHCIPTKNVAPTTYYHVVPAYMSILSFAFLNDINNKWFCLLTESCVPIISPALFRKIFLYYHHASIIGIKPAYWNLDFHHRGNLRLLNKDFHLANDPWFTLTRDHVHKAIFFMVKKQDIYQFHWLISVVSFGSASLSSFSFKFSSESTFIILRFSKTASIMTLLPTPESPLKITPQVPKN
jgi:hypothetical protein